MTPRQQLTLLRVVRVVSWIVGIAVMVPLMSGRHGSLTFREAIPLLTGIAVIFLPDAVLRMALPARCSACGEKVYVEVKQHDVPGREEGSVRAFTWRCATCGEVEQIPTTWVDRLLTPRFESSSGTNGSNDVGE